MWYMLHKIDSSEYVTKCCSMWYVSIYAAALSATSATGFMYSYITCVIITN